MFGCGSDDVPPAADGVVGPGPVAYADLYAHFRDLVESAPVDPNAAMPADMLATVRRPHTGRECWSHVGGVPGREWRRGYETEVGWALIWNPETLYPYDANDRATEAGLACFANTGGNGVHYSFLCRDGVPLGDSPVVLTHPGGSGHMVVGENLREFLCLGVPTGYFVLEQLFFQPRMFDDYPDVGDLAATGKTKAAVAGLVARFQLDPWPRKSVAGRLKELDQKYRPLLPPNN